MKIGVAQSISPRQCNVSPLWGKKPQNCPLPPPPKKLFKYQCMHCEHLAGKLRVGLSLNSTGNLNVVT